MYLTGIHQNRLDLLFLLTGVGTKSVSISGDSEITSQDPSRVSVLNKSLWKIHLRSSDSLTTMVYLRVFGLTVNYVVILLYK